MLLSIIIPAHNEEKHITETVVNLINILSQNSIPHEIIVINDSSTDNTEVKLQDISSKHASFRYINNTPPNGFGRAIKKGLEIYEGDAVAIVMADASDSPDDLVKFYRKLTSGYDCVFGSRFHRDGEVVDYPKVKFILNRLGNFLIKKVIWH